MKGVNPEWLALPKRACDNCGTKYKPKQPLRPGQKHGFCKPNCKKEFHKNSGAYRKLKVEMQKLVEQEFGRINAGLKELRALWIKTEARAVAIQTAAPPRRSRTAPLSNH